MNRYFITRVHIVSAIDQKKYHARTVMEENGFRIIEQMFLYCDICTHERTNIIRIKN